MPAYAEPLWVYLDQNKWIDLARAYYIRADGTRFIPTLNRLQEAIKHDGARVPVSSDNIVEIVKDRNAERRQRLAHVMATICQTRTLAPQHAITPYEIDASIAEIFHHPIPLVRPPVFGKGVRFAFGKVENSDTSESTLQELRLLLDIPELVAFFVKNPGNPQLTEHLQKQLRYVAERTSYAIADVNNAVQNSPEFLTYILSFVDESERQLGLTSFAGFIHRIMAEQKNMREAGRQYNRDMRRRGFAARLNSDPAIQALLQSSLQKVGRSFQDFLALGREQILAFWDSIPTLHVETTLESERDEQRSREIDANDVIDVSFLSVAIPYCDIVVTERFWVDLAKRNRLDQTYDTILLTDLADLEQHLPIYE